MKFKIKKSDMLKGLQKVQGATSSSNTVPILSNVLVNAESDGVTITATDLEMGIRVRLQAVVETPGAVAVPSKKLLELVRELSAEEISMALQAGEKVKIVSGASTFKLAGISKDEYPAFPEANEAEMFEIEKAILGDMVKKAVFAAAEADSRYVLNGVLVDIIKSGAGMKVRMVATDSHRLALVERSLGVTVKEQKAIIPKKAMSELRRFLDDPGEQKTVKVGFTKSHVVFNQEGAVMVSKLIDGLYPNYQQVLPSNNKKIVIVEKEAFGGALKRMSILSNQKTSSIAFAISNGKVGLEAKSADIGESSEIVPAEYAGEELTIGFNVRYVQDAIAAMGSQKLILHLADPLSPGLITEAGMEDYKCVVMPLRL